VRIVAGWPPNRQQIVDALGDAPATAVYAYGDAIYSPSGSKTLPLHLVVHEQTHLAQQRRAGGVEAWWRLYLSDGGFRLEQEVEAYRAQLGAMNRQERRRLRCKLARDLAGPMYGHVVAYERALELLA